MGQDKIRYLVFVSGRWRWRPTKRMRAAGFALVNFGRALTPADQARAITLNCEWDKVRRGICAAPEKVYPTGSVGDGYTRTMALRAAERAAKGIAWTKEQESRDDWPRAWKWLEPVFADVDPSTVQPEHFLRLDVVTGQPTGLLVKIESKVSATERHRTVKVWRALWKKMAAMGFCRLEADPTLTFSNGAPEPRQHVWHHREVLKHVQMAWRLGFKGLAACIAVGWDTMLSPVDARRLTLGQMARDEHGAIFLLGRAKTGRAAAGTLTPWCEAVLDAYIKTLPFELLDNAPIFRTPGASAGPKGGRRWQPRPYSKNKLGKDFRIVRAAIDPDDRRQLADMRRSGAVEADAGGTSDEDLSNKMANTINASARLRKTYAPVNVVSVRRVDEARQRGSGKLKERRPDKSVMTSAEKVS
jgi:hypothetical protein